MKKLFTLVAFLGIFAGATMNAQEFPGDPGTVIVEISLSAFTSGGDSLAYPPTGGGAHTMGDSVVISAQEIPGYTFKNWSDEVEDATRRIVASENMRLIAYYDANEYTITFMNDGEEFATYHSYYGDTLVLDQLPTKQATDEYTFIFKGWDPALARVTDDATYVAQYDSIKNKYLIKFWNMENLLLEDSVEYGVIPQYTAPQEPTREPETTDSCTLNFIFNGWQPTPVAVTGDADYVAKFDTSIVMNEYVITFMNMDAILERDTVEHGQMPVYNGETPTRDTEYGVVYTFEGWEPAISPATEDMTYTAMYSDSMITYIIKVYYENDSMIYRATYGQEVEISAVEVDGKHFVQWSDGDQNESRVITVTEDLVLTAIYADSYVDIDVAAGKWTFFCLPVISEGNGWNEDLFIYEGLADPAWGTYNGVTRSGGASGWETPEEYNATQGYILWSQSAGRLRLNVYPTALAQDQVTVSLKAYAAEYPENANWNFVGNPLNKQISASAISISGEQEATATIWNGTGYDNVPFSTEALIFTPLQAFFIQTSGEGVMSINTASPAPARNAIRAQVAENSRIDIEATAGGYTDKSRVIFRSNSSLKYEAGRDASKFMTATAPIQMYMLDVDNVQCAQMVRPAGEDAILLGYMLRQAGEIEINIPVYAEDYELYDSYADRSYYLGETITIYSEAGTYDDRLMLRPVRRVATAIENNAAATATTKMIINDQLYLLRDGKLYSIQGLLVK